MKFVNIIVTFAVLIAIAYAGQMNFLATAIVIASIGFLVLLLSVDREGRADEWEN